MEKSPSGRISRQLCKEHLRGTCTNPSCKKWQSPSAFFNAETGCKFGGKCVFAHRRVEEQSSKRSPEAQWLWWKRQRIWVAYFCPGEPHQRNLNSPEFEDQLQAEPEWQEHWRSNVEVGKEDPDIKRWKKTLHSHQRKSGVSLHHPKASRRKEEFVVDSGASMQMTSRKDLNSAELETVKFSRIPITVITANGEVQTHEEATVYVKQLDILLTVKILDDTPAVLIAWKTFRGWRMFIWVEQWSKTMSHQIWYSDTKQHGKLRFQSWFTGCRRLLLR